MHTAAAMAMRRRRRRRCHPTVHFSSVRLHVCRHLSCRSGVSRTALRCRALSEGRPHGSADEAALQTLMMKLREDDVEYFELKARRLAYCLQLQRLLQLGWHVRELLPTSQSKLPFRHAAACWGPLPFSCRL